MTLRCYHLSSVRPNLQHIFPLLHNGPLFFCLPCDIHFCTELSAPCQIVPSADLHEGFASSKVQEAASASARPTEADCSLEFLLALCHAGVIKGKLLPFIDVPQSVDSNCKALACGHHDSLAVWRTAVTHATHKCSLYMVMRVTPHA